MTDGLVPFFVLACAFTFAMDATMAGAWLTGRAPPDWALGLAGLGAWGPTIAAVAVSWRSGRVRDAFRPWATNPAWVVLALLLPMALRLPATAVAAALGHAPERWIQLPARPENWIALVMFSLGEEFGWRGFAQRRVVDRWGPTAGPLLLGLAWAAWHAGMMATPDGRIDWLQWGMLWATFPPFCVLFERLMSRGRGSLWIALALHAGGHLDNVNALPHDAWLIRGLYVGIVWVAALAVPPAARP